MKVAMKRLLLVCILVEIYRILIFARPPAGCKQFALARYISLHYDMTANITICNEINETFQWLSIQRSALLCGILFLIKQIIVLKICHITEYGNWLIIHHPVVRNIQIYTLMYVNTIARPVDSIASRFYGVVFLLLHTQRFECIVSLHLCLFPVGMK